jgi:hypothetical protein
VAGGAEVEGVAVLNETGEGAREDKSANSPDYESDD